VSRGAIERLLLFFDSERIADERAEFLREILALHVVRVASVGPTGRTERVYDLEVGGDHEYQTGPILSHNCERSSDIVTASWIDEELVKQGQMLIQCLKSRDQRPFDPFTASVFWPSRRIRTLEDPFVEDMTNALATIDLTDGT
jgi:hypothetical protein